MLRTLSTLLGLTCAAAAQLPQDPPVGLPQLLTATASASSEGPAGGAPLAVDGDLATRWESAHGVDPSWLMLDLGTPFALHGVVIHWEAANAETYTIDGSLDGVDWVTLAVRSGGQFGDRVDQVELGGAYRLVRMNGLTRSAGNLWGYSIWEMEVYGLPAQDSDGDGVDDSVDLCPDTPPGTRVDEYGCPLVVHGDEVDFATGVLVGGALTPWPGHTLYVFDDDLAVPDESACYGSCADTWPPVLVEDGVASGVGGLGTIQRQDLTLQATHQGRPLYFFSGDAAPGEQNGQGAGGTWWVVPYVQPYVPLFDEGTTLEPPLQEDTPTALITRLSDRARDRHAREDEFQQYDHYLSFYWEHRTAAIEIVDTVGKGGDTITFNVATQWQLSPTEAELRFFYRGINTVAEYWNNGVMQPDPDKDVPGEDVRHYTRSVSFNPKTGAPLKVGDRLEFELSQFLLSVPNGRNSYYGTAILYVVGEGVVPWEARGVFGDPSTELEDSFPMPEAGWLGGGTTLPYQYSDEPDNHLLQMPGNLSATNGQVFVRGRRILHTDLGDGSHDEAPDNPDFQELAGTLGPSYVGRSCIACHPRNGRALPPAVGQPLDRYVVRVGDAAGGPHPQLGTVLQPKRTSGAPEGGVSLAGWDESGGLRTLDLRFSGVTPDHYSARLAPQLVGLGLLEAIRETDVEALADPSDLDGDGLSGRMQLVADAETGAPRLGRFGWKATQPRVRHQVAAALNTDLGVMTSVFPDPDCGAQQSDCGSSGAELADAHLVDLSAYVSLLGVSARRDLEDPVALKGEALFRQVGCADCHVETFQTSPYHPHAELRDQTIHPYTDLLLHDMGPGLASTLLEGEASPAEWRTPPLWNLGLTGGVSGGEAYLHDGRARTLHEAILWHGGEGDASRQAYLALTLGQRKALRAFLRSL